MEIKDLPSVFRLVIYQLRSGRREKAYGTLMVLFFGAGVALGHLPQGGLKISILDIGKIANYTQSLAYILGSAFLVLVIYRVWKESIAPNGEGALPPSSAAIKGLLPFTETDGELFARLGRPNELQRLLSVARNYSIGVCAVRGQSGAGKTSLLQAGLTFNLGIEHSVYWEATPVSPGAALLRAIQSRFPQVSSLDTLPNDFLGRCVLILDQFEQLSERVPGHAPVFDLLERIARSPAPRALSAVVGFRREYLPDWGDFEDHRGFQAEHVPINLFAPPIAAEILTVLTGEAGITLDNALVTNFVAAATRPEGVSPVDIAIGVLSLANFVQQRGVFSISNDDYATAGGAEGLLLSFVREKLEEIPENLRTPLLKGLVLSLIDPTNNQRIALGATADEIACKAEVYESVLLPSLNRLTRSNVRLLEKPDDNHYRLPHERLVPVLRRLAGLLLVEQDQARIRFEGEFAQWRESEAKRHLLTGKDLRNALRVRQYLLQGDTAGQKSRYLKASIRRRTKYRVATVGVLFVLGIASYQTVRAANAWIQRDRLYSWGLSPALLTAQYAVDSVSISAPAMSDLTWLKARQVRDLTLTCSCWMVDPLSRLSKLAKLSLNASAKLDNLSLFEKLPGITTLNLNMDGSQVKDLSGVKKLSGLTSLALNLHNTQVKDISAIETLTQLNELDLTLDGSPVNDVSALKSLPRLAHLTVHLNYAQMKGLTGMETLAERTKLSLDFTNTRVKDLSDLEKLVGLNSLSIDLGDSLVQDLSGLEKVTGLVSLGIDLGDTQEFEDHAPVTDLSPLGKLTRLKSLDLTMGDSPVKNLSGLNKLVGLTSLTIDLSDSPTRDLSALGKLTGLTSLDLNLGTGQPADVSVLAKLASLTNLTLDVGGTQVSDLSILENLSSLTSLTLKLDGSQVKNLPSLEKLSDLSSLTLTPGNSQVNDFSNLEKLRSLTSLNLNLKSSQVKDLSSLAKVTGLRNLTLDLTNSQVGSLSGLEKLTGLTSLTLTLTNLQAKDLSELKSLDHLKYLRITAPAKLLQTFPGDKNLRNIAQVTISLSRDDKELKFPVGFQSIALVDSASYQ